MACEVCGKLTFGEASIAGMCDDCIFNSVVLSRESSPGGHIAAVYEGSDLLKPGQPVVYTGERSRCGLPVVRKPHVPLGLGDPWDTREPIDTSTPARLQEQAFLADRWAPEVALRKLRAEEEDRRRGVL